MDNYFFALFPNETFLDLRPYQFGWENCRPLHSFGPGVRNHYLFHYIFSGRGTLLSQASDGEDREYRLEAGQGFLICPGQITTYAADAQEPWKYAWMEFDGMRAAEFLRQAGLGQEQPVYEPRTPEDGARIGEQMLYFCDHTDASALHLVGRLSLLLDRLIESSSQRRAPDRRAREDFYIHEAVTYIQQNYHRELTVDEVAGFCKLNRSYFSRRFKELVGCAPQEFLIRQRLTAAAELLRTTDRPIKSVADQCGYPNQLHFSQAFRKRYGLPPREWRKQNKRKPPV